MKSNAQKSILLVEDEVLIAMGEQKALERYGYKVRSVSSGLEAIEAVSAPNSFDLILMDIDLGEGIDGTEAAAQILRLRDLPIVFLSSHVEPEIVAKTENITSYGYIVKNLSITVMDASIKMAFRLFYANREIQEKESRFESLFENAPIGIVYSTLDGKILSVNAAYARILGYASPEEAKELINRSSLAELVYAEPEVRRRLIEEELADVGSWVRTVQSYRRKDGSLILAKADFRVTREDSNVLEGYLEDITEQKKAEEALRGLLDEKELVLREVHHRIKNSMNTMKSLVYLHRTGLTNAEAIAALHDVESRFTSMTLLYDKLYQASSFGSMSIRSYLPSLVEEIVRNFPNGGSIQIVDDIDDFMLDIKFLQTLGIIVNEILTNIMKYAFTEAAQAMIAVEAKRDGGRFRIAIRDNGRGMPEDIDFDSSPGFGLMIISQLTSQLGGTIRIERAAGTGIILEFDF